MAKSHLRTVFAVNIAQAVAAQNAPEERELRQLARLLQQPEALFQYARRALRSPDHRGVLHVVLAVFEVKKDARVVRPLVAWLRHETDPYLVTSALWCLSGYDCSAHLPFLVRRLASIAQETEAAHVFVMVLQAMKGPFAAPSVRTAIHALSRPPVDAASEDFPVLQCLRAQAVETCARFYRTAAAAELVVHGGRDKKSKADT